MDSKRRNHRSRYPNRLRRLGTERNGKHFKPLQSGAVTTQEIKAIIAEQNIEIRPGDILFLRVGITAAYNALSASQQQEYPERQPVGLLGLEATQEYLRWLWESQFAAVASDSPSFERGPVNGPFNDPDVSVHQWALADWGLPLGEMFDLEELASTAKSLGIYSFFLTSFPIKVCGKPSCRFLVRVSDSLYRFLEELQVPQMQSQSFKYRQNIVLDEDMESL